MSYQQTYNQEFDWSLLSQLTTPSHSVGHHHGNMTPATSQYAYMDKAGYQPHGGAGYQHPQPVPAGSAAVYQYGQAPVGMPPHGYQPVWPDQGTKDAPLSLSNPCPEWGTGSQTQQSTGHFSSAISAHGRAAESAANTETPWSSPPSDSGLPPTSRPIQSRQFVIPESPQPTQILKARPLTSNHSPTPTSGTASGQDKPRALAVVFPVMEPPPGQAPRTIEEPRPELTTKRKAAKSVTPLKKLPSYGDSFSCKPCKLVCSGPLNLRTHFKTAKHKVNEKKTTEEGASEADRPSEEKLIFKTAKSNPIPADHNQELTPIVGLDFVTRVVIAGLEDNEDMFECSLCTEEGIEATDIYAHVLGETHRLAYIKKNKPNLADQYTNIANVYKSTGQLQRRQSSDLSALLTNLVKIAAQRDGPGDLQIRLCNEKGEGEEGEVDYGVEGFNSDSDDFGEMLSEDGDSDDDVRCPEVEIPRSKKVEKQPGVEPEAEARSPSDDAVVESTLPTQESGDSGSSVSTPYPPRRAPPLSIRQPPHGKGRAHATPSQAPRPSPVPNKPSPAPATTLLLLPSRDKPPPLTRFGSGRPPKQLSAPKQASAKKPGNLSLADLPSLTDEQLRFCCSDVFIAQEYRRRFGQSTPPPSSSKSGPSSQKSKSGASDGSLEELLKYLSEAVVSTEHEANVAMELTRALTQATLKFRLREKSSV